MERMMTVTRQSADHHKDSMEYSYGCSSSSTSSPSAKSNKDAKKASLCCKLVIASIVLLTMWNVSLQCRTYLHGQQLRQLELKLTDLQDILNRQHKTSYHSHVDAATLTRQKRALTENVQNTDVMSTSLESQDLLNTDSSIDTESTATTELTSAEQPTWLRRIKRDTEEKQKKERKRKKEKKSLLQDNRSFGAHFAAHIDRESFSRNVAQGITPDIGSFHNNGGFIPNDNVYRFWKPATWNNPDVFRYNESTGKVTIQQTGFYMIYGQVVFHGSSARKSFGIHIDNGTNPSSVPFVESLAFDNIHIRDRPVAASSSTVSGLLWGLSNGGGSTGNSETVQDDLDYTAREAKARERRSLDENAEANSPSQHQHRIRHRRGTNYSSYNQCNTLAVAYVEKNSKVYLKTLDNNRPVIVQPYLTFWGLAKL